MTFLDARGRWDDNCYVTKRPTIYPTKYRYLRKNDCLQYTNLEIQKSTASSSVFCQARDGDFFKSVNKSAISSGFHMENGNKLEFRSSSKDIMEQINCPWFVQYHKSFCVNLKYIDCVTAQNIIMVNQDNIPIGRNKKRLF